MHVVGAMVEEQNTGVKSAERECLARALRWTAWNSGTGLWIGSTPTRYSEYAGVALNPGIHLIFPSVLLLGLEGFILRFGRSPTNVLHWVVAGDNSLWW